MKTLRLKLVLAIILPVLLVLLTTVGAIYGFTANRLKAESLAAMEHRYHRLFDDRYSPAAPPSLVEREQILTFCVALDGEGQVAQVMGATVSDPQVLQQVVTQCLESGQERGLTNFNRLRYWVTRAGTRTVILFADRTGELNVLAGLLRLCLPVAGVAALALLGLSFLLAYLVAKPVERAWQQQSRFVADASHELKTPLTAILANVSILRAHRQEGGEGDKWLGYIDDEATRMKRLTEDLLYLARADADRHLPRRHGPVCLSEAVWGAVLPLESVAYEQGKTLEYTVADGLWVRGDGEQLRRLCTILTDNALKYCGEGGFVCVSLSAAGGKAVLEVRNGGTPIDPKDLPHLFERFYRADGARSRDTGGFGLGLSLASEILRAHKGGVEVHSDARRGTVFTVTLPLTEKGEKK